MEEGNTVKGGGRRRRIVIVLAASILVGIGVVAFWPGEREPEYNGKKLSEWIKAYELRYDDDDETNRLVEKRRQAADDAMRHMGTNTLHWLVRWIAYERPVWKTKIRRLVWKIPAKPIRYWCIEDEWLRSYARDAFEALGTNGVAAVPELAQVVTTSRYADARDAAMWALGQMGKDGFPPLLTALGNPSTKYRAAYCMVEISAAAVDIGPAMPALLLMDREMRYDSEEFEKANPAAIYHDSDTHYVLSGLLEENRPFLIPALNNCLHHTNSDVRVEAAGALGSLGDKARPAVPALREALDDRVIAVQEAAIIALEKIAPEVLTNGVKEF